MHITSYRYAAEFGHYRRIADSGKASARQIYGFTASPTSECNAIPSFNPPVQLAPKAAGHVVDDIAQPRMRWLVVKPPQPDHGGFDRLGRTRQPMENKWHACAHAALIASAHRCQLLAIETARSDDAALRRDIVRIVRAVHEG